MRLLATAAVLTLSLATTPAIAQVAAPAATLVDGTILDITATGKTTRVPDVAVIRAGVVTQAATAAAAMADNSKRMTAVLAALKSAGIAARDIATASISLQPQYRYEDNKPPVVTGYQASNSVSIRFRDLAKAGTILDTLVRLGANTIDGPNLTIDKPEAAQDEARVDAIRVARARAELYARAAGLSVVRIVTISENGEFSPPVVPVAFKARGFAADSAQSVPIVAGETDITINVSVRFLLK